MDRLLKTDCDVSSMPSLSLAFVGDSVYDLLVREYLATCDRRRVGELNKKKIDLVCCGAQSNAFSVIEGALTEEELAVYKRGRNTAVHSRSKSGSVKDYHNATGLEALFGYLYLSGYTERIRELFMMIIEGDSE